MPDMGVPSFATPKNSLSNVTINRGSPKISKNNGPTTGRDQKNKIDKNVIDRINGEQAQGVYKERKNELGKEDFLKFLTFQMQNQDPTKPMDQKKITAELAQISQLEQMSGIKKILENQGKNLGIEKKYYASGLINKMATVDGSLLTVKEIGKPQTIRFSVEKNAPNALVRIFDKKNNMIDQFEARNLYKGHNEIIWDGKRLDGQFAGKGSYRFNIIARDEHFAPLKVKTKVAGRIQGVEFNNGDTLLTLDNGSRVSLRNVDKLEEYKKNNTITKQKNKIEQQDLASHKKNKTFNHMKEKF